MSRRSLRRTKGRNASIPPKKDRREARPLRKVLGIWGSTVAVAFLILGIGAALVWSYIQRIHDAASQLAEARTLLKSGKAGKAEQALYSAVATETHNNEFDKGADHAPEAYRLLLEILRVEDRSLEADRLAWQAISRLKSVDHLMILRELTLALLTDLPDDIARSALTRWSDADPTDIEARVALLRRISAMPRSSDPDRPSRVEQLSSLLAVDPGRVNTREALVSELADAGEPDGGRKALDAWPGVEADRDARYWRLRGRWDLEYDYQPARSIEAFRKVLAEQPHDWRTRYRLARALRQVGRDDDANSEAETVRRIREVLDPLTLGPKLDAFLSRIDDPHARLELAEICARAGLARLAEAWRKRSNR
jgi:thioredoxin-like negative regulator of GroEL